MRKLTHWAGWIGAAAAFSLVGIVALVECADPRESEQVSVVTSCAPDAGVFEKLSTSPSSPESTVVAYVNASESLATKVTEMDNLLRDGCNDVDTELGLPTGTDPGSACQPISQLIAKVRQSQPPAIPGTPSWFGITFPPVCHVDPNARATCLNTCSVSDAGACDNGHCAQATQVSGTCNGTCVGQCTTVAADPDAGAPCLGSCQGTCTDLTADGGSAANACTGECNGLCLGPSYAGYCATGCGDPNNSAKAFVGECDGTCTGTCDGNPINGGVPDGGLGIEGGTLPAGNDGNCTGICNGWCSSKAYGNCPFACAGAPSYHGGVCTTSCKNTCVSGAGAGCSGVCNGTCTFATGDAGTNCTGICKGTCQGTISDGTCAGDLACGQNLECNNACTAAAAATITCDAPVSIEVEAISDLKLYNALKAKGAKIGEALQMLSTLRTAEGYVDSRALSDFAAIGASGEVVRACVARGQAAVQQAASGISAAVAADPTATKSQ